MRPGREAPPPYRSLISALEEGVIFADAAGVISAFNASALRILGVDPAGLRDRPVSDPRWHVVGEDGAPVSPEAYPLAVTLGTGEPQTGVVVGILRPDGSARWLSVNTRPVGPPHSDRVDGAVASFVDITERREMECRLQESEARLRDAQRGSRIGGWEWDMRADRVSCSLELYRVFDMAPGDLAPKWEGFLRRLPAATREAVRESGRRALRSREAVSYTYESGAGTGTRVVEARAEVRRDDRDTPVRLIGTVQDVTGCAPLLSPRQRQVLDLLAHGLTGDEIASRLYLSGETIRTHVRNAMERLGAHTRGQAIALALARQEIQRPDDSPF